MGDERSRVRWGMMGALMDVAFVSGGIQWDLGSLMEINSLNRLGDSLGDPRFPCTAPDLLGSFPIYSPLKIWFDTTVRKSPISLYQ